MTYIKMLRNSTRLIRTGFPDQSYWRQTGQEIKFLWEGVQWVSSQFFSLVLWFLITCTFPISLPIITLLAYINAPRVEKKKRDRIREYEEVLKPNKRRY